MKEPDMEGVASHHGPVSCAGGGNIAGEASIGVRIGQPLSSEITTLGVPTGLSGREGHVGRRVRRERRSDPTESKTLCMCGSSMPENREIPVVPRGLTALGTVGEGPWPKSRHARRWEV